jgi:hypothetical protein
MQGMGNPVHVIAALTSARWYRAGSAMQGLGNAIQGWVCHAGAGECSTRLGVPCKGWGMQYTAECAKQGLGNAVMQGLGNAVQGCKCHARAEGCSTRLGVPFKGWGMQHRVVSAMQGQGNAIHGRRLQYRVAVSTGRQPAQGWDTLDVPRGVQEAAAAQLF